jgi:hypothetical protein
MSCLNRLIRVIQKRSVGRVRHERTAIRYPAYKRRILATGVLRKYRGGAP